MNTDRRDVSDEDTGVAADTDAAAQTCAAGNVPSAIVIGASAGGVEALNVLLPALPASAEWSERNAAMATARTQMPGPSMASMGMPPSPPTPRQAPIVIVLHLPSNGPSDLATLFAARCRRLVMEASDREPLRDGVIYFAPPGYHLLINDDRHCALSVDLPVNFSRPSIDVLFESAAWAYGAGLLGILLTGASADGAAGMAAIREAGGHTWAQQPDTARAPVMPLSAIERGVVDHILSLDEMADALGRSTRNATLDTGETGLGRSYPWPLADAPGGQAANDDASNNDDRDLKR